MRVEADFARRVVSRPAATIALACALALAGFACPADAAATAASAGHAPTDAPSAHAPRGSGAVAVALEEQSLPPEDLSSPVASPAASPAALPAPPAGSQSPGGAGNAAQGGVQAPVAPGATLAPAAQASPQGSSDDEGAGGGGSGEGSGWTRVPAEAGGASASGSAGAAAVTGAPARTAGVPFAPGEPAPEATPTEAPPPYEVGSVQATAPVSDQPLTGLIASTKDQPALNASLRFAEQGRKALETSRLDDAIRDLGRAISIDPTDPYAYFYLGRAYMLKKDYTQALAFFGRSEVGLRAVPAWLGEVKSFEGVCLEEQGKFPAAAAAYKQALDAAPGNLMARAGYGRLSENLSDANAGDAAPPPPPADGAALPAPEVNLAPPAPAEAAPPTADSDHSDSGADAGDDSGVDSTGAAAGRSNGPGAQSNR
jgi:TPR repeat/Tetratricopeptide repeat